MIDLIRAVEGFTLGSVERTQPPPGNRPDERGVWSGDVRALEKALRRRVGGEVRFDDGSRALYSTDASNYRQIPIGVVIPKTVDDVITAVEVARSFGAPIFARGGGTSLAGQCCNTGILLDFSKYLDRILEINVQERWARVQPGVVLDDLRSAALEHGLTYGPDPATHSHNTLGGMIGNNSCGMHAQMAGKVEENIYELEILTYDGLRMTVGETTPAQLDVVCARTDRTGEIYRELRRIRDTYAAQIRDRFPNIPRRVSGYPLQELLPEHGFNVARSLVGTECTCVIVLSAKVKLIENPDQRCILVLAFEDVYEAADAVARVNAHRPIALEGLDDRLLHFMGVKHFHTNDEWLLPSGSGKAQGWLMCEFGFAGDRQKAIEAARACEADLLAHGAIGSNLITDELQQKELWQVRESGLGATAKIPDAPEFHPGWEDSAVPPDMLGSYLRDLRALYDKYGYEAALYGHFGQGCIHCRVSFDLATREGVRRWQEFLHEAARTIRRYGGSLSGEHGDGQARGDLLGIMYGEEIVEAFRRFKRVWDPNGKMNPGKVVDAYAVDTNLREGPYYRPREPQTHFSFAQDDRGSFAYAANRCVGVGKCRRHDGGTMCPSYRVTREEKHATRGRARLLFEMLEGAPLRDGWQSEAVKSALDLCLACKGCKHDCPVNVDMATYKAEFLAHYYQRKRRPVWAYAFGLIPWWAYLGSKIARLANAATQAPGLSAMAKAVIGMAPARRIPAFAEQSFKEWYRRHRSRRPNAGKKRVILWPDTFNNYFHAETARHALEVLESAGYDVVVPRRRLCCGRPLYDYGMLDLAKVMLREIIEELRPEINAGTPIVALEPSCASVFKDELLNLYPSDMDAKRLSDRVMMFGDFLAGQESWVAPRLNASATVHAHCHHKSVLGTQGDEQVLKAMGITAHWLDDGCCGMAGAFGFEAGEHYDVSLKAGELAYLPHVRETPADALVIGNGFSCREQAAQTTNRQVLHLADVVWLAQRRSARSALEKNPELLAMPSIEQQVGRARRDALTIAGLALFAGAAITAVLLRRGRKSVKGVAVVTGASAGVGRACVRQFAREGYDVGLIARGVDGLAAAKTEVEALGRRAAFVVADVADERAVEAAAARMEAELGPIDVWTNVAFSNVFAEFKDLTADEYRRITEVTYLGYVHGTMAALCRMLRRNSGTIIQVGSALAYRSIPLQSAYCGAKAAIRGFTDSLRSELLHAGSAVELSMAILPAVNTPQFTWCRSKLPRKAQPVPPIYQPEVIARGVVWLAQHPRRELRIGWSTIKALVAQNLVPGLVDRILAKSGYQSQQYDGATRKDRPDNLDHPLPGDWGAHGDFDARARSWSAQLWLATHPRSAAVAATVTASLIGLTARRVLRLWP